MKSLKNISQKITLTLALFLVAILTISTNVQAKGKESLDTYKLGGIYSREGLNFIEAYANTYCVDYGGRLNHNKYYSFLVYNKITIEGKTAKNESSGKDWYRYVKGIGVVTQGRDDGNATSTNDHNAMLAYILAQDQGYGELNSETDGQKCVWKVWNNFVDGLGFNSWSNMKNDTEAPAVTNNSVYQGAIEYADKLNTTTNVDVADKTILEDNSRVAVNLVKYNTKDLNYISDKPLEETINYIQVGPFNWEYTGDLDNLTVTDENGAEIEGEVKYLRSIDGKDTVGKAKEIIAPNKNFYMLLSPSKSAVTKIKVSVKMQNNHTEYNGTLLMLRAIGAQKMILADFKEETKHDEKTTDLTYTLDTGDLELVKKDAYYKENKTLSGVKFKIQHKNTGLYIKQENGKIKYVISVNEATEFVTDGNGQIKINNIIPGEYNAIETENNNKNYKLHPGITTKVVVKPGKDDEYNKYNVQEPKPVKVSGNVWSFYKDGKNEKAIDRNESLYKNSRDELLEGIKVELYRYKKLELKYDENGELLPIEEEDLIDIPNGELVGTAITDKDGHYTFKTKDIRYAELELKYYKVKFTYDGMDYQACHPNYNDNNLPETNKHNKVFIGRTKALEDANARKNLNENFAIISGEENNNLTKGYARKEDQTKTATLKYKYSNGISEVDIKDLSKQSAVNVTATYSLLSGDPNGNPGYSAYYNNYENDDKEIYGEVVRINLGLVSREMPDLTVRNQIENVVTTINGYNNRYTTTPSRNNLYPENSSLKVGVSYVTNEETLSKLVVYPSDVEKWADVNMPASSKLQVYVTYKIGITNQATSELYNKVRELAIYYDPNYELLFVGKDLDSKKFDYAATNDLKDKSSATSKYDKDLTLSEEGKKYNKICLDLSEDLIAKQTTSYVYTTFKVSDSEVQKMLTDGKVNSYVPTMKNVVEINAYSTYSKENVNGKEKFVKYAGIDKDSAAGNMTATTQIDDDTGVAREFKITHDGIRTLTGTTFLDKTNLEGTDVKIGEERYGDGIYNENDDKKLQNVKVTLVGKKGNSTNVTTGEKVEVYAQNYNAIYNEKTETEDGVEGNNTYKISGFIPGDYVVKYEYGNKTYYDNENNTINAVDYKSTRVTNVKGKTEVRTAFEKGKDDWYKLDNPKKGNFGPFERYNEAVDDFARRKEIDDNYKNMNIANTGKSTTKYEGTIAAQTPTMGIAVELDTISDDNTYVPANYHIVNMDFGVTERPRQKLELVKQVSNVKITLSNGQVLIDGKIVEDKNGKRKLETKVDGVKFIPANKETKSLGVLDIELDSELIHGATLEIGYEMKVKNVSELDYSDEEYYRYGTGGVNKVKLTPGRIADYTSNALSFDNADATNTRYGWKVATTEIIETNDEAKTSIIKIDDNMAVNNELYTDVNNNIVTKGNINTVVTTDYLSNKAGLITGETSETVKLNLTKLLSNTDEDMTYYNDAEVLTASKDFGRTIVAQIGTYNSEHNTGIGGSSEEITITPPTGSQEDYMMYYVIGATAILAIAGVTIFVAIKCKSKNN